VQLRRDPFVWQVQVRREVLDEEIHRLREVPYSVWHGTLRRDMIKEARARDNKLYRVRISTDWAHSGSDDIRVTAALESPGLRRRLMDQSFVITPDNQFRS
jgi:hypothetical protein